MEGFVNIDKHINISQNINNIKKATAFSTTVNTKGEHLLVNKIVICAWHCGNMYSYIFIYYHFTSVVIEIIVKNSRLNSNITHTFNQTHTFKL